MEMYTAAVMVAIVVVDRGPPHCVTQTIMEFGAPKHYDSNFFEASHKPVKSAYKCAAPYKHAMPDPVGLLKIACQLPNLSKLQLHSMLSTSVRSVLYATLAGPDAISESFRDCLGCLGMQGHKQEEGPRRSATVHG